MAVLFEEQQLSYGELERRANQMAHALRGLGVGPEEMVALCLERGIEMVVGLLGTLKAGGAYAPLDAEWPAERLGAMLEEMRPRVALTQARLAGRLRGAGVRTLCLDEEWDRIGAQGDERVRSGVDGANLAYVIYTSGSTGRPKGVAIAHAQITNYVGGITPRLGETQGAGFGLVSGLTADLGHTALFPSLCGGGRLHVIGEGRLRDGAEMAEYFSREVIDILKIVPAHLEGLQRGVREGDLMPRRMLVLGGDVSRREWVERLRELRPECGILNHYGPTETTVGVISHRVGEAKCGEETVTLPLGRPLSNTRVYVTDGEMGLTPVGVIGELYIGGAGVGRGYLGRSDLTAERFVPDPYGGAGGERLYRSGDLVRRRSEGELEFIGRADHQVKVRGYRIELGEVEAALRLHPAVREAVVVAREDRPGDKRLAAYWVRREGEKAGERELREHLRRRLPEYMAPSWLVELERLPLTRNGKVDRGALPDPGQVVEAGKEYQEPRTEVEGVLAAIWAQTLGVDRVGARDNFFELGSHSLLATQVVARIRRAFHVEIALRELFDRPTVEELAERVELALRAGQGVDAPPIEAVPRGRELPLSFAQQRLWFLDQLEPGICVYNCPAAVRLKGRLGVETLEATLREVVRRHEVLRTSFPATEGRPRQHVEEAVEIRLPLVDFGGLPEGRGEEMARELVREEAERPFDLSKGPLVRARLLKLGEEEHALSFTLHHIVSDGWSMGILIREVTELYGAYLEGEPSGLEELKAQYADFAHWQREWLKGEALEKQMSYWRGQLGSGPPALDLPTDRPRPEVMSHRGAQQTFELDEELTAGLKRLSREEGVTLFMTLLAAFQTLLCRYSGQEDVAVGVPIANRNRAETEPLIGFFVNTLVLRTDLSGNPTFRELLRRVRETALGAYAHQDLPFEKLVEELQPERRLSHSPLFQVMFVLQRDNQEAPSLSGLTLKPEQAESGTAKFDLTLSMEEVGNRLVGALEYNTNLFDAETISGVANHYTTLLNEVVINLEERVLQLRLLTEDEQKKLREWSETAEDFNLTQILHELFEAEVAKAPEKASGLDLGFLRLSTL
ncbi:MAG: amino acid adenylation domain-containing protein [Acidobacteria bacterium]|nr:amino acid adenylation domain-containing protein [Acidobacteriota bacterium]